MKCSCDVSHNWNNVFVLPNLYIGEGPYLKVFSKKGDLLAQEELLPFRRIYGIRLGTHK